MLNLRFPYFYNFYQLLDELKHCLICLVNLSAVEMADFLLGIP